MAYKISGLLTLAHGTSGREYTAAVPWLGVFRVDHQQVLGSARSGGLQSLPTMAFGRCDGQRAWFVVFELKVWGRRLREAGAPSVGSSPSPPSPAFRLDLSAAFASPRPPSLSSPHSAAFLSLLVFFVVHPPVVVIGAEIPCSAGHTVGFVNTREAMPQPATPGDQSGGWAGRERGRMLGRDMVDPNRVREILNGLRQRVGRRSGGLKRLGWNGHPLPGAFCYGRARASPRPKLAARRGWHAPPSLFFCFRCVSQNRLAAAQRDPSCRLAGWWGVVCSLRGRDWAPGARRARLACPNA